MASIPTPRDHVRRVSSIETPLEMNRWATDIDNRIVEILECLRQAISRVNILTTHSTSSPIGAHAPQHYPQTGFDPLLTAAHTGGYALTTTVGTADTLLRSDARLLFPTALAEYTSNSTLVLTATVADQTLTGNLGALNIMSGNDFINLDKYVSCGTSTATTSAVLRLGGRVSALSSAIRFAIDADLTFDSSGASFTGLSFGGLRFQATSSAANTTFTNCSMDVASVVSSGNLSSTTSFNTLRGLLVQVGFPGQTGAGVVDVDNAYGIQIAPWSGALIAGTPHYENCYGLHITFPRVGYSIRQAVHLATNTNNSYTEVPNSEMIYIEGLKRGTSQRTSISIEGHNANSATTTVTLECGGHTIGTNRYGGIFRAHTAGTCTTAYCLYAESPQVGTASRYGLYVQGSITGAPTVSYGVYSDTQFVGTNRWSYYGVNKVECTASDFIASTAAKGYICKDSQGTARYWRQYISTSGTTSVDAIYSVDVNGILSVTRGASPAGTVILNVQDVGTAAPLT